MRYLFENSEILTNKIRRLYTEKVCTTCMWKNSPVDCPPCRLCSSAAGEMHAYMSSKIDTIEFIERYLGIDLLQSQKDLLRKMDELNQKGFDIAFMPSLGRFVLIPKNTIKGD